MTLVPRRTRVVGQAWLLVCDAPGCHVSTPLRATDELTICRAVAAARWTHRDTVVGRQGVAHGEDLCPEHRRF